MSTIFLVRNLLSARVAIHLARSQRGEVYYWFENSRDRNIVTSAFNEVIGRDYVVSKIYLKKFFCGRGLTSDEHRKLDVADKIYVTYPFHLLAGYIYTRYNKKTWVYEEGTCFYLEKKEHVSSLKRNAFMQLLRIYPFCLNLGYIARPRKGHTVHPYNDFQQVMPFKKCEDTGVGRSLLLSRPNFQDMPSMPKEVYKKILVRSLNELSLENIDIKFHPRESDIERRFVVDIMTELEVQINIVESKCSAEELLESGEYNLVIGYETATLAYANLISNKLQVYSMLESVLEYDKTGRLRGFYKNYSRLYEHIKFI